jgi:hypothetical protein
MSATGAHRRSGRALICLLTIMLVVLPAPPKAQAAFLATAAGSLSASSGTLAAPGPVTMSLSQCGLVILDPPAIRVTWTATASTYATGYVVTPYVGAVAGLPVTVSGRSTTSVDVPVTRVVTYSFQVTATYRNWTSAATTSATTAKCPLLTV